MRYFKTYIFFASLLLVLSRSATAGEPLVRITYSHGLDTACSFLRGYTIEEDWINELESREQEFQNLWEVLGPKMMGATGQITGKYFSEKELTARLTLCDLPSQSFFGISINMRYALTSFTKTPVPMSYKVNTLFHELLHNYFSEHPINNSVLLKRYASEPNRTKDHIHLFALQKAVLIKLNETEMLETQIKIDSQLPDGYYKRAWEIVNATDSEYLDYVAEITQ